MAPRQNLHNSRYAMAPPQASGNREVMQADVSADVLEKIGPGIYIYIYIYIYAADVPADVKLYSHHIMVSSFM